MGVSGSCIGMSGIVIELSGWLVSSSVADTCTGIFVIVSELSVCSIGVGSPGESATSQDRRLLGGVQLRTCGRSCKRTDHVPRRLV